MNRSSFIDLATCQMLEFLSLVYRLISRRILFDLISNRGLLINNIKNALNTIWTS
jgi:hypothetical protein